MLEPDLTPEILEQLARPGRPKAIEWIAAGSSGRQVQVQGTELWVDESSWSLAMGDELPCDVLLLIVCDGVTSSCDEHRFLRRPDRGQVTSTTQRLVPLDVLVRGAIEHRSIYARPETLTATGLVQPVAVYGDVQERYRNGLAALAARESESDLERVAAVYRAAVADGEHPTAAVERELGLPNRNTAKKWVQRARATGLLPPAVGQRRGGISATTTGKSRSTKGKR